MVKKIINFIILLILVVISNYADLVFPQIDLKNFFYTSIALTMCYLVFEIFLNGIIKNRIDDDKLQYSFKKTVDILFLTIFAVITLRIWIVNPQALLVSYGIIGAGLAVALQDMFKNFAGGLIIITNKLYRVNDRIEIHNKCGDVIDIGILYTTIFEIKEWVGGDQPTGRITKIPNGLVLFNSVNNYTQDHNFIWDEIEIVLTYNSNWQKAIKQILKIIDKDTLKFEELAKKGIKKLKQRYYLTKKELKPQAFLSITDNWIALSFRYLTDAKQRRQIKHDLSFKILKMIEKSKDMEISSSTSIINITSFPELKIKNYEEKNKIILLVIVVLVLIGLVAYFYFWYQDTNNLRKQSKAQINKAQQFDVLSEEISQEKERCQQFINQESGQFEEFQYCQKFIQWQNTLNILKP